MSYEQNTIDRLVQCHGIERARLIVAGQDPATNRDIARWERLGSLAEAGSQRRKTADLHEKIVRLCRSGIHPYLVGERLGMSESSVQIIWNRARSK